MGMPWAPVPPMTKILVTVSDDIVTGLRSPSVTVAR
jgi:hypothetical protein